MKKNILKNDDNDEKYDDVINLSIWSKNFFIEIYFRFIKKFSSDFITKKFFKFYQIFFFNEKKKTQII